MSWESSVTNTPNKREKQQHQYHRYFLQLILRINLAQLQSGDLNQFRSPESGRHCKSTRNVHRYFFKWNSIPNVAKTNSTAKGPILLTNFNGPSTLPAIVHYRLQLVAFQTSFFVAVKGQKPVYPDVLIEISPDKPVQCCLTVKVLWFKYTGRIVTVKCAIIGFV